MIDTALWSLEYNNDLDFVISQSTLPEDIRSTIPFKISTLSFVIPELAKKYALDQDFELNCYPRIAPAFDINPTGIQNLVDVVCQFLVPVSKTQID